MIDGEGLGDLTVSMIAESSGGKTRQKPPILQCNGAMCNATIHTPTKLQWCFSTTKSLHCTGKTTTFVYCYILPLFHCTATLMSSGGKTINTGYISLIFPSQSTFCCQKYNLLHSTMDYYIESIPITFQYTMH